MATAHDASSTSRLQSLPAELRNRIYRETFNHDEPVTITSNHFPEPALLRVCKQLRNEASPIFYGERTFKVDASHFRTDPTLIYKQKSFLVNEHFNVEMKGLVVITTRSFHWPNMLIALRRAHKGYPLGKDEKSEEPIDVLVETVNSAFATARDLRDLPWHRVEPMMERYHNILTAHNGGWA